MSRDLPSHPDAGHDADHGAPQRSRSEPVAGGVSRSRRALLIVGGVALVVLFLVLHLTGVVGEGSH